MITFMQLQEGLHRCAGMLMEPDKYTRQQFIKELHAVLTDIPDWLDKDCLDPMDPLMKIYENYDWIMLKAVNEQYFTISVTDRTGKEVEVTLPTLVADKGIKWYKEHFVTAPLPKENTPPVPIIPGGIALGFKKLDPRAKIPCYAHEGDAGMDIFALEDVDVPLCTPTMIHTGIAAEIPEGYEIQVRPRSGLACKGVTVWNSPGTVDSKYRGEICVILMFFHRVQHQYEVKAGDKIAQLVLAPVTFANPFEVQELSVTDRGTGGFGSTGR